MPPGLLNVVPGDGEAGEARIRHRGVDKISFTGGVATARRVMATAADVLKPVFLELGGTEIFGPVLSVIRFDTEEEAIAMANDSELGLGAYIQTGSLDRAHRLAARLEAGYINVNGFSNMEPAAPFGGYKNSGFGRIGGRAGLEEFLQTKTIYLGIDQGPR
jgi:acyl-CoA reductase-like NAD-dependent aldehyde dehydrogenase